MASDLFPATIPLTEPERRRVEFAGGTPILIAREPWRFFEPIPVERPVRGEGGDEVSVIAWEFGPGLDAETNDALGRGFQKVLDKIARATDEAGRACGMMEAAWFLLARNYVLTREEFEDLLLRDGARGVARADRLASSLSALVAGAVGRFVAVVERKARAATSSGEAA